MTLFKVKPDATAWLSGQPETAMGFQLVRRSGSEPLLIVWGGQVAAILGDILMPSEGPDGFLGLEWRTADEDRVGLFDRWKNSLDVIEIDKNSTVLPSSSLFLIVSAPSTALPAPPAAPTPVYGHTPFLASTEPGDVFYRWEAWPASRRIDPTTGAVSPGTFTAPNSEVMFMPTGFSAVARLALPSLLPACFRWELHPPAGTSVLCGACVPLYGQAGGGVEVVFPAGFTNAGAIAAPVILPAL
jgi:hypothetical protein